MCRAKTSVWYEKLIFSDVPTDAYGLSEAVVIVTGTVVTVSQQNLSKGFKSVGVPVGFSEVKIVDEADPYKELQERQVGEVALRGPGICKGYWRKDEETKRVFLPDG